MIIALDFDGTCCKMDFPHAGDELPGCIDTLKFIRARGHTIILWTCRTGLFLEQAKEWFRARGFEPDYYNENAPGVEERFLQDFPEAEIGRKILADMYIDDRNWGGFPGWDDIEYWFATLRKEN